MVVFIAICNALKLKRVDFILIVTAIGTIKCVSENKNEIYRNVCDQSHEIIYNKKKKTQHTQNNTFRLFFDSVI